jgi:hypothetical protein
MSKAHLKQIIRKRRSDINCGKYKDFLKCSTCIRLKASMRRRVGAVALGELRKQFAGHLQEQREQRMKFWKHNDKAWYVLSREYGYRVVFNVLRFLMCC